MSAKMAEMIVRAIHEWFNENLPDEDYDYNDIRDIVFDTMNDRKDVIIWTYKDKTENLRITSIEGYVDSVIEEELDSFIENLPWM